MRTVVITGGGSGLGRALAHAWARRGWRVVVTDAFEERARETCTQLPNAGDCLAYQLDVTCDEHFTAVVDDLARRVGSIDLLINNAGIGSAGRFEITPMSEWERVIDVDLMGVVRGCHRLFELLKAGEGGHIVNIASFAGIANAPGMAAYNVAKAGVVSLSETLRGEWARHNIGVSVVCPSFFQTNLLADMQCYGVDAKRVANKLMQASSIQADEVAAAIVAAVDKQQFLVIPHTDARFLARLKRLAPNWFHRLVNKKAAPMVLHGAANER